ncbi:MAG: methyl-accepting chemotaxis protein [Oscillospiraceae bacterium]
MKNISVGKKLLLGFGAVVAMIAVILALTIVTSTTRSADLQRVNQMSDLQRTANTMLDNFNLARVEIRSLFTSIDAEEEYNLAMEYLAECGQNLDTMETMAADLDGYLLGDIEVLRQLFVEVENGLNAVSSNDQGANVAIDRMRESTTVMSESSTELFNIVAGLIVAGGQDDPVWAVERLENALVPVEVLGEVVGGVVANANELMAAQNTAVVAGLYTGLDEVARQGAEVGEALTTDDAKASFERMMNAVEECRTAIGETEDILLDSEVAIASAREVFLNLNDVVNNYVDTVATDVNTLNESTMATSQQTTYILVVVGGVAAIFSIIVAVILARMITRPLNKMKMVATQVGSTGNLVFTDEVKEDVRREGQSKDELGQSIKAFTEFVDRVTYVGECMERVANKDLTVEVELLSDQDTMGIALQDMLANLNGMFAEINSISSQVATAANEIAMGAQSLAQGSTEQASTVQQISASINEVNEQMGVSNETALQAAQQSDNMSHIAEVGNEKMSQMTGAMQEINEASQSIGQVIKVIDDIAFQTNILALNAAVEAARAGEHGKGFAVVADEVRNLAGKSADAAKETAALISTNIEKTEMGLTYTQETAENLTQIMQGIGETRQSLQTVSSQSESAKAATTQVTLAVDQVAQVVQQNSATSEESAAASEEMSSQAQVLQQLIAQFKLKQSGKQAMGLPARNEMPPVDDESIFEGQKGADIIF